LIRLNASNGFGTTYKVSLPVAKVALKTEFPRSGRYK